MGTRWVWVGMAVLAAAAQAAPVPAEAPRQNSERMGAAPRMALASDGGAEQEAESRRQVTRRLDAFVATGQKATLGFLRDLVDGSIAFGAPAYNRGDIEGCARFYMKTAEAVTAAFPEAKATAAGAHGLEALRAALSRCALVSSFDRRAWLMRYAFDRIALDWQLLTLRARGLVGLATQSLGGERYTEAADAYGEAAGAVDELVGEDPAQVDGGLRAAGMMQGNALLGERDFAGAARALDAGLERVPEWPHRPLDLHKVFRPARLDALVKELEAAAAKPGASADLAFTLGYVYHCAGKQDAATAQFKKALAQDAGHRGALRYVK